MRVGKRRLVGGLAAGAAVIVVAGGLAAASHTGRHATATARHRALVVLPHHDGDVLAAATPGPPTTATPPAVGAAPSPHATPIVELPPSCTAAQMAATISTDGSAYSGGEWIRIDTAVRNVSSGPCMAPPACNGIPISVSGPQWSGPVDWGIGGCTVPVDWHPPVLRPGESTDYSASWDQVELAFCNGQLCPRRYAPSGTYRVHADWMPGVAATSGPFSIHVAGCRNADLGLSLASDRPEYAAGEGVHLTARVSWAAGGYPVRTCAMPAGVAFSAETWGVQVWSACPGWCGPGGTAVIGPGADLTVTATWDQSACTDAGCGTEAPRGSYTVLADFGALGRVSRTITLR